MRNSAELLMQTLSNFGTEFEDQNECLEIIENHMNKTLHENQKNLLLSFLSWQYEGIGSDLDEGEELMVDKFLEENQY